MKNLTIIAFFFVASTLGFAQTTWNVDKMHSSLNFEIQHSGISFVTGKLTDFTGTLVTSKEDFSDAKFDFVAQVESIDTSVEPRDKHLKSADFFDVEKYPTITFKSTKIVADDDANEFELHGDLTIKDVTKSVVFDLKLGGVAKSEKGEKVGFEAETKINRFDFNIDYDPTAVGIGKDVELEIHLQFAKAK